MDLLEYLAQFLRCDYLSDLRRAAITPAQAAALRAIHAPEYRPSEYQEAADYILGRHVPCPTPRDALEAIAEYLLSLNGSETP